MKTRASLTLLSAWLLVSPASACRVEEFEPPKEVSFQDGLGGKLLFVSHLTRATNLGTQKFI